MIQRKSSISLSLLPSKSPGYALRHQLASYSFLHFLNLTGTNRLAPRCSDQVAWIGGPFSACFSAVAAPPVTFPRPHSSNSDRDGFVADGQKNQEPSGCKTPTYVYARSYLVGCWSKLPTWVATAHHPLTVTTTVCNSATWRRLRPPSPTSCSGSQFPHGDVETVPSILPAGGHILSCPRSTGRWYF